MDRVVKAHTPLGEDQLLFRSMHGNEGLSQLFEFEVDLLSPNTSVDMKAVLGKPLTLEIVTLNGTPRYLNGQITRFTMIGREESSSRYVVYRALVQPWLWYLTRTSDCKIFQNKSVVDILDEVLGEYGFAFEKKLSATYRQRDYSVQYQETDFAFVSRLMEHEGIYYYFKHEKKQHILVLADDMGAHETLPGYPRIGYLATDRGGEQGREVIDQWEVTEEIRPGTFVVDDFDFKKPKADLLNTRSQPRGNDHGQYEMYEWLGGYSDAGQGEHYARIRLEEAQAQAEVDTGHCNVRGMAPGYCFRMQNAPRDEDNKEYLIVSVTYNLREGGYATGAAQGLYSFNFGVQPTSFPFRAPRVTRMPTTHGPQTATVVGPPGEDIWIDKYGRVKVQFRWDRYGQRNEDSSCWVRVSSAWAGSNFGAVNHPRVGQEVIVDFIAGCPDRPIIIGRVYNADQMPPLELPAKATVSGFISRTIKGDGELANHFVIDDDPGCESIKIHAQKDFTLEVENNELHTVDGERTTFIKGADTYTGDTSLDETINGPHTLTVNEGGPQKITVNGGDQFIKVNGGTQDVYVDGEQIIHVTGQRTDTVDDGEKRYIKPFSWEQVTGTRYLNVTQHTFEELKSKHTKASEYLSETSDTYRSIVTGSYYQADIGSTYTVDTKGDITFRAPGKNWLVEADKITHSSNQNEVKYRTGVTTEAGGYIRSHSKDETVTKSDGRIESKAPDIRTDATSSLTVWAKNNYTFTQIFALNIGQMLFDMKTAKMNVSGLNIALDSIACSLAICRNNTSALHMYW
ncbi:type VI secretion system secreted protein VgrG [Variovorax boronicumulans]|uniref:type VI secretion system Vgr family protein n=1 Tax=Variovorax boronicumulans TaxID=436515 RepID=UPI002789A327|nr:type VI secretion system tip protein VgrG [Variovorax boronicumulans]MDQ0017438.1 type VI secretion system secreted protein VgrG [Variovorax boronicumulans]